LIERKYDFENHSGIEQYSLTNSESMYWFLRKVDKRESEQAFSITYETTEKALNFFSANH